MNRTNQVNQITEGAMIVALIGSVLILDRYFAGLIESFFFWLIPIPLAVYAVKHGFRNTLVVTAALIIVAFMLATWQMFVLVIFSVMTGIIYGSFVRKDYRVLIVITLTFLVTYSYQYLSTYLLASFFNYSLDAEIEELANLFLYLPQIYRLIPNIDKNQLLSFFRLLMPIVILIISAVQTYLTHILTSLILLRLQIKKVVIVPLNALKISKSTGLVALIIMIGGYWLYALNMNNNSGAFFLIIALFNTMLFLTFGMVLVNIYSASRNNVILPFVSVFLLFLAPYIIIILGIIDVFTNIREMLVRRMIDERKGRSL